MATMECRRTFPGAWPIPTGWCRLLKRSILRPCTKPSLTWGSQPSCGRCGLASQSRVCRFSFYLILAGLARFLVEIIRINPRVLWGLSQAQILSIAMVAFGLGLMLYLQRRREAS